ncbi:hypothetical protein CHUAL_001660, partial [Chamberlinius hualienensis]
ECCDIALKNDFYIVKRTSERSSVSEKKASVNGSFIPSAPKKNWFLGRDIYHHWRKEESLYFLDIGNRVAHIIHVTYAAIFAIYLYIIFYKQSSNVKVERFGKWKDGGVQLDYTLGVLPLCVLVLLININYTADRLDDTIKA